MQGDAHRKKEIVQDVTLHDLDSANGMFLDNHTSDWQTAAVQGDVHKKKEIVQDVTLHDLDAANGMFLDVYTSEWCWTLPMACFWTITGVIGELLPCRVMYTRRRRLYKM